MRSDDDMRSLLRTVGGAALGIGIGLGILVLGYVVSRIALPDNVIEATTLASPIVAASAATSARGSASVGPAATATTTPRPSPTADPLVVTGFQGQGLRLAALTVPAGYTLTSPIAGTVRIEGYQFVDGRIVTGVSDQPTYPYVFIRSNDRKIKLRPGVAGTDVQLLVKDGDTVAAGAPLLKTLTTGPSSWHTFYDANVNAQIVASVTAQPAGTEVDPVPVFKK